SGRSDSQGMSSTAIFTPGRPTKASPIMPERPRPSSVRASPVATWFVTSVNVRKANSSEKAAPTRMDAMRPSQGEPVMYAAAKPETAPMIIMPSTPRLSTPARSTTSSPVAAIRSGVAAVAMVSRTSSNVSMRGLPRSRRLAAHQSHAVVDQRVAGEHEEQDRALEGAHHLVGYADRDLCRLAAEIGERQNKSRRHDAERVKASKEGHDDGGEAVADRDLFVEVLDRAGDLADAGESGESARQQECEEHHPGG